MPRYAWKTLKPVLALAIEQALGRFADAEAAKDQACQPPKNTIKNMKYIKRSVCLTRFTLELMLRLLISDTVLLCG